jgi:phosphoglycolate phosphatase-like HAD superfamily hydrolase
MKAERSNNPAILLDLDGTLIDSVYEHVIAWAASLRSVGIVVPNWKIHRRIGMNGKSMVRQLLREPEVDRRAIKVGPLEEKHDVAFKQAISKIRLLPGARELLRCLGQSGVRWAIATTGNRKQTKRLLRDLRIPPQTVVITGDDVMKAKPPRCIRSRCDALGRTDRKLHCRWRQPLGHACRWKTESAWWAS